MGSLYIVPTPLGNLEDVTLRALRILREVSLIATEDTRTTKKLLNHYEIDSPLISYFEHSRSSQIDRIVEALGQGDVALVSEAGTPLLSDPGYRLVKAVIEQGYNIIPLPGPSAVTTALPASGLATDQFFFLGFLSRKSGERRRSLQAVADIPATLLFFEAPHRLQATLEDMAEILGAERRVAICRELTKLYEEIWRGTLGKAQQVWRERKPRGEFTLVVSGADPAAAVWTEEAVAAGLAAALASGSTAKDAVRQLTDQSGWRKRDVYRLVQTVQGAADGAGGVGDDPPRSSPRQTPGMKPPE